MDIEKNPPRSTPSSRCLGSGFSSAALAALLAVALGACGNGGSSAPAPTPPPTLALPNLADATPVTLTVGMMGSVSFTNSGGGSLTGCAPTGALPAGLVLSRTSDNSSCQISGAPMSAAAVVTITVTASNATGPDATPATVRITVVAAPRLAAPDLADAPDAMLTVGQRATIPFTNSGGGSLTGCAPTGALPAGLALSPTPDSSSCQITGAPMSAAAVVTITVTASNAAGPDATPATVRITVAAAPRLAAPDLADAPDAMLTVGQQATIPFTNSGGGSLTGCASTDALPAGLALSPTPDSSSCQITGAPMSAAAAVTITVTASNAAGPDATPATVSIAVGLDVPTSGDLVVIGPAGVVSPNSVAIATFDVDQANGGIKFESVTNTSAPDGSAKMKYSVDSASGEVTVTITSDTSGVSFFTTLFTSDISREDVVRDLRRFDGGRISFELQSDEWGAYGASGKSDGLVFKVDHFIPNNGPRFCGCDQSIDVSGAGTAWTKFTVDVDDMAGSSRMGNARLNLELVKTSFVLWPNVDLQRLVSGSTITGATELTFKIRNVKWEPPGSAPDLANAAASTLELGVEVSGSAAIAFANSGGPPASGGCTATGLPSGLAVGLTPDGSSCQVSGTPNAPGAATVTVTATDSKGRASSATVMITVADSTAPVVTAPAPTDLSGGASRVNVQSGEDGTAYILVLPRDNARTLTAAQVKAMAAAPGADARVVGVKGGEGLAAAIAGLAASTDYTAYIVVTDAAGNDSALVEANFSTTATADQADPTVTEDATMRVVRAGSVSLTLTANESSDLYALALPSADAAPGAAAIKSPSTGALAGTAYAAASAATAVTVDGLAAGTAYIVYFIATDTAGNDSTVGMTPQLSTNTAPVANAGADQDVAADAMVTLTGTGTDAEDDAAGTALSYAWAQTAGTTVALSGAATATASFDAGEASDDGETLTFELTVTDSAGDTHTDEVDITVAPALGGVAPHASISLHAAGSAPDISASYGTPVTIFDGTFMNLFTEPFTYEGGANEHDEDAGLVRASVKASGDSARGDVIEYSSGTEGGAVFGIGEDINPQGRANVDLSAYNGGLLQFDLRVTDAPDDTSAVYNFNIRHTPSGSTQSVEDAAIGGAVDVGLNQWRTVRVDFAMEPWASGVTWSSVDVLQAFPTWGKAAGTVMQLDNIIIYPPASSVAEAPVLADLGLRTVRTGRSVSLAFPNTGGAPASGCTLTSGTLPAGLSAATTANGLSCEITGNPTSTTTSDAMVEVTGANAAGMDTATATIRVTDVSTAAPHASISLHAADSAPDISTSYGTPVTIFDGTFMNNLFTEPFTYEHGATEHDEGTGQVLASVKASGDSARGNVIEFTTGTENQAVLGIGEDRNTQSRADVDLSAYTDGLLQFDLRVTDAPDSSDATFVFNIRHTPSGMGTTEPGARPIGGQAEVGLNQWRTVRVDLAEEPWASGVTWDSVDALQASPLWDHGAGATVQLDNIIIYPPPGPAPTPMLTGVDDANVEATTAEINLTSDVAGTAYVAVLANDATAPDAAAVKAAVAGTGGVVAKASGPATAGTQATVPLAGLMASTMYDAYVVVEGTGGGLSAVIKVDLTTAAPPTPMLTAVANANVEATTADINLTSDVGGTAYVAVLENDAAAPTAAAVVGAVVTPGAIFATGSVAVAAAMPATVPLTGLVASTRYDAYVVVQAAGVLSAVMKVDVDTLARSSFDLREENDAFAFVVNSLYDNSEDSASIAPAGAEIPLRNPDDFFISACSLVSVEGEDVVEGAVVTSDGLGIPEGMQLEPSSGGNFCSFTGIPTEYAPLRTYGVSASVGGPAIGMSNRRISIAEIAFKVATQAEPDFDIPFLVLERGVDYTAAPYALVVNRGGFVETCVHHDDSAPLPTGLVIGLSAKVGETSGGADLADTCQITGMASASLGLTDSDGSPNAYAFNTDATKEEDTKVQANYYVVAAATAGALTPEARPNGERLRTFYSAGGVPFPDAYGGRYFEGLFGGVELRFPSAGTITRCRLSDESEPLPPPFAVAPNSNGSGCIIGPRVAHSTEAPWTSFGPTDFQVIASSSQATAEPRALRIEAIVGDYEDPVLSAPTFPSGGTAGKVVIPMSNTKITPIPLPNTGGKLSGTWRQGCAADDLPAGLGVRIATEEDAGESLEEGETCVIYGTPGTVAAEASIGLDYPSHHVGDRGYSLGAVRFTIEVTTP